MNKFMSLAFALFLLAPAVARAEGEGPRDRHGAGPEKMEERIEHRLNRLDKRLDLTEEQRTKIEGILRSRMEKSREEFRKMREKMRAEKKETEDQIRAVLTDDQKAKLDSIAKERREKEKKRKMTGKERRKE